MPGICIAVAASAIVLARFPDAVTLAWQHTVEKTRWEETYRREGGHLLLVEARVAGTGAGMDIPDDARLDNGMWRYRPQLPPLNEVVITNSMLPNGYEICATAGCVRLRDLIGEEQRPLRLSACGG